MPTAIVARAIYLAEDFEHPPRALPGAVDYVACADEAELLTEFWEVVLHYDSIITFNRRGFDVPFLYMRSALFKCPNHAQGLKLGLPLQHRAALRSFWSN